MIEMKNTNKYPKHEDQCKRKVQRIKSATVITAFLVATALSHGIPAAEGFSLQSHQFVTQQRSFINSQSFGTSTPINTHTHAHTKVNANAQTCTTLSDTALFVKKERRSESRYGVRRRVRSVLKRAKNRTGIRNNSDYLDKQNELEEEREANSKMSIFNIESISSDNYSFGTEESVNGNEDENEKVNVNGQKVPETEVIASTASVTESESDSDANLIQINGIENSDSDDESIADISTSTVPVKAPNTIDPDSSVNVIAEAASIGGIGPVKLDYPRKDTNKMINKTKPASTYSNSNDLKPAPGDDLISSERLTEIDGIRGDVPAAFVMPPPPLPFTLPDLTKSQKKLLMSGERVQFQSDMGREGSGFVVVDVKAPSAVVWECLLDFYSYPQTIPTVRDVQMFTNTHLNADIYSEEAVKRQKYEDGTLATLKHGVPSVTRAAFTLSKFRLKIAAIHKYRPHPRGDYMVFTLDPSCTNLVLKNAKGVWHTQSNPDGRGDEYTRVWLLCELGVSPLLPQWITDYAAKRAMPRATTWVKPHVEAAAELWFKGLEA